MDNIAGNYTWSCFFCGHLSDLYSILGHWSLHQFQKAEVDGKGHIHNSCTMFSIMKMHCKTKIHPGRLTWNLKITHLERKMIFQTSTIMFHVNLPGCTHIIHVWYIYLHLLDCYSKCMWKTPYMDSMGYTVISLLYHFKWAWNKKSVLFIVRCGYATPPQLHGDFYNKNRVPFRNPANHTGV